MAKQRPAANDGAELVVNKPDSITIPTMVVGVPTPTPGKDSVPLPDGFEDAPRPQATATVDAPRAVPMWSEVTVRQTGRTA
jgi:hypothetical protein